jgi:hypothetical protein
MAIKLSNLTFSDEHDIIPAFGVEQILNTEVANTLVDDDRTVGTDNDYGFKNVGVLNPDDDNTITGIGNLQPGFGSSYAIVNSSTLSTTEDNDIITGISRDDGVINSGTLNVDEDNDIITGTTSSHRRNTRGLTIHSIKCINNSADLLNGPDDTYIKINGTKVWGDYNMSSGQTRSVDLFVINRPSIFMPRVELFDKDGWGNDDPLGAFTPIETNGMIRMEQVHGSGSTYEVYYSYSYQRSSSYSPGRRP